MSRSQGPDGLRYYSIDSLVLSSSHQLPGGITGCLGCIISYCLGSVSGQPDKNASSESKELIFKHGEPEYSHRIQKNASNITQMWVL